jgi:hypothetical protein
MLYDVYANGSVQFPKILDKFHCSLTSGAIQFIDGLFSYVLMHISSINEKFNHLVFQPNRVQPIDSPDVISYFYF